MTIQNVNSIQHIVPYAKCFEGDPSRFSVTPEIIKAVCGSCKRYRERIAAEEELVAARQRPRDAAEAGSSDDGQNALPKEVETALKMPTNAELFISHGANYPRTFFDDFESGQSLLARSKARL